jgi:hypothetical protein
LSAPATSRFLAAAATSAAALAALLSAPAGAASPSGVKVRILDTTCYGPCVVDQTEFPLYDGEATVIVRKLATGPRVAAIAVYDGRARKRLAPGRYELEARIAESRRPCWEGDTATVRVREARFARVRLRVANTCIV